MQHSKVEKSPSSNFFSPVMLILVLEVMDLGLVARSNHILAELPGIRSLLLLLFHCFV